MYRYEPDHRCPSPSEPEQRQLKGLWRLAVLLTAMFVLLSATLWHEARATVTTAIHETYAVRTCSTCKEIAYPTEVECENAAQAEAQRVGATRTSGSAVYTCIKRYNVIATFKAGTSGQATLSWTHDGLNTTKYVATYWRDGEIAKTLEIPGNTLRSVTLTGLNAGVWNVFVSAVNCEPNKECTPSGPSITRQKIVQ